MCGCGILFILFPPGIFFFYRRYVCILNPLSVGLNEETVQKWITDNCYLKITSLLNREMINGATVVQEVEKSFSNQKVASSIPCRSVLEQDTEPLIAPDVQCAISVNVKCVYIQVAHK